LNLVYGVEAVLPPEIYLESTRVTHFNAEDQVEARELDTNLLEERLSHPEILISECEPFFHKKLKISKKNSFILT
jgi:hypothetical protein